MNKILTGIISFLALCQVGILNAQSPKLFVMISVEELRADLLEELSKQMPRDGLIKLMESGWLYTEVCHPLLSADATASEAILHTGTTALASGVPARQPLIKLSDGRRISMPSVFEDPSFIGYATSDRRSPVALSAMTIADQLKQSSNGIGIVYSVAPSAEEAIIGGGQFANGVFWVDDDTGRWVSSTYYPEGLPHYIERLNSTNDGIVSKLNRSATWVPVYQTSFQEKYVLPLGNGESISFNHTFNRTSQDIIRYKNSALINENLIEVSKRLLQNTLLGHDNVTDLLSIHLSVGAGKNAQTDISSEVIDGYYRLDRSIAILLEEIEKTVGLSNTLIALSGNATATARTPLVKEQRIFRASRCKALTNMYLHAEFGQQGLVDEISANGEVFLNHERIKSNGAITLEEVQTAVSQFLLDFSGIQYAIEEFRLRTIAIANSENRHWQSALNKSLHKHRADVVFELLPGWVSEDLSQNSGFRSDRQNAIPTIFILAHPELKPEKIQKPIDLREVSKIIARTLKIRPPTT